MAFESKIFRNKKWDELTDYERRLDFELKSEQLYHYGEEITSATFYQDYLFKDIDKIFEGDLKILLTNYDAEIGNKVNKISVDEIDEFLSFNNVAISPCLFQKNWRNKKLLEYVCAFVLDIDKVRPYDMPDFFKVFDEGLIPVPSFIANSGSGVHFYYVLDKMFNINPIRNKYNYNLAEVIYAKLYDFVHKAGWYDAQRHWIGQDYRVVNSKTKYGQTSAIFKTGDIYTIDELSKICGVSIDQLIETEHHFYQPTTKMINWAMDISKGLQIEPPCLDNPSEVYEFIKKNKERYKKYKIQKKDDYFKDTSNHLKTIKPKKIKVTQKQDEDITSGGFYEYTYNQILQRANPGKRYNACKALAVIAYKEKIPEEKFMEDLEDLIEYWDIKFSKDKVNKKNIEALKRLYENGGKYVRTLATTLESEGWLGFKFERKESKRSKNNKKDNVNLTREEILEEARLLRDLRCKRRGVKWDDNNGRKKATIETSYVAQKIKKYLELHPNAKIREIMEETGATYPTVKKWYDIIKNNTDTIPSPQQLQLDLEDIQITKVKTRGRKKGSIKDVTTSTTANAIKKYLLKKPSATKYEVIKNTGLSKKTVYKWYDQVKELIENEKDDKQMTIYDYIEE